MCAYICIMYVHGSYLWSSVMHIYTHTYTHTMCVYVHDVYTWIISEEYSCIIYTHTHTHIYHVILVNNVCVHLYTV